MRTGLVISAALLALAACSTPAATDKAGESSPAPVAVGTPPAPKPATTAAAPAPEAPPAPAITVAPGKTLDQATATTMGTAVAGEIVTGGTSNFYRFDNPLKQRDIVRVRLENKSATLRPSMKLFNNDRSSLASKYDMTPGASVEQLVSLSPGQAIYVEVEPYGSAGPYHVSATPLRAYDVNEPNDDQLTPTALPVGQTIDGSIMDEGDHDWFRVTGAQTAKVTVVLDNQSSTLKPNVRIYSATKSQKLERYDGTPGAGLDFVADVEAGKDFYVHVLPYGSMGKYKLSIKASQ
jgi:hypothetical protein